ncbi:palmitoyltransferase ZDHHC6 [Diorhabda sublineata]|uniref:palmitoyltransferase ZDHHC6 n=1 Tax=Diorhabda sublineata TaxID=1163346 RepID=UPI0024E1559D|nr:palmitoyltransferase ZDHHC6 [Diorhabda sublineata]XP_056639610.1 palmitoyltransferase ZDHHC6 [Diorhabda sublineata]
MFIGHFTRICHWGPLTALGIIKVITAMTIHCSNMWWPRNTIGGKINFFCFISFAGLTLYNFLSSVYHGPGYLQLKWKPEKEEYCKFLQFCVQCQGYKAPRSHHCRKCGRCVLKMDHHCPWINNCVGWGNHAHFVFFLTFASVGCFQASVILSCCLYRSIHRVRYYHYGDVSVQFGLYGMICCVLALGLSIGVVAAVGMLLYFQIRAVVKNRTGIEDWILEKAVARRRPSGESFKFPYDLGPIKNIRQVINFSCQPVGDGIMSWPTAEGCNEFSLTIEQIEQKQEKRLKSRLYKIVKAASGYWFPISFGIRVCLSYPFTDEPRIQLDVGDSVIVTRWRKHWLFGEKLQVDEHTERIRGWFPRKCAVELIENNTEPSTSNHHNSNHTSTSGHKRHKIFSDKKKK